MSYRISKQSGKTTYNLKEFTVDVESDRFKIDTRQLAVGSTVFVIDTSTSYMLNSKREWKEVDLGGGNKNNPDKYHIIYDGGVVKAPKEEDEITEYEVIYDGGEEGVN